MFTVALCQYEYAGVATVDDLCTRAEALFEAAGPADLYVLPELFATDFTATETRRPRLDLTAAGHSGRNYR